MRFMMLVKQAENQGPPPKGFMEVMAKLGEEAVKAGTMVISGGLAPTTASTRVRLSKGHVNAIDGPFTEAKEVVGGFAILEYRSKKEALEGALGDPEDDDPHDGPDGGPGGGTRAMLAALRRLQAVNRPSAAASAAPVP